MFILMDRLTKKGNFFCKKHFYKATWKGTDAAVISLLILGRKGRDFFISQDPKRWMQGCHEFKGGEQIPPGMLQPYPHYRSGWEHGLMKTKKPANKQAFGTLPKICQSCSLNMWSGNVFRCRCFVQPAHHLCQAQDAGHVVAIPSSGYLQTYLFTSLDARAFPSFYLFILKNHSAC